MQKMPQNPNNSLDIYGNPILKRGYIRVYNMFNEFEDITVEEFDKKLIEDRNNMYLNTKRKSVIIE